MVQIYLYIYRFLVRKETKMKIYSITSYFWFSFPHVRRFTVNGLYGAKAFSLLYFIIAARGAQRRNSLLKIE